MSLARAIIPLVQAFAAGNFCHEAAATLFLHEEKLEQGRTFSGWAGFTCDSA
ncbi:hypothetical protein [Stappia sp.]|uniref:hypothetical protein n=1 Tax=Stappia sp. TaxID=1870903 RepID=UPI0025D671B5|nr:hypothetical protein [Stappia sp.]|tara:strand:- start:488 stop:643 length:156 start_codon:yes stop_codon:yes gene_type:complete